MKYTINKDRLIKLTVSMINPEIEEYYIEEKDGRYALNNREGKCIMNYLPSSKELYYDHSLWEYISKFLPLGWDIDLFQEGVKEYFNSQFPDLNVRRVYGANIVTF
jgi:hypothetical protein